MQEHLSWVFRPLTATSKPQVDFNLLLVLVDFQTYNLEFCKNELFLNDEQTASALNFLWRLLEFKPQGADGGSYEIPKNSIVSISFHEGTKPEGEEASQD